MSNNRSIIDLARIVMFSQHKFISHPVVFFPIFVCWLPSTIVLLTIALQIHTLLPCCYYIQIIVLLCHVSCVFRDIMKFLNYRLILYSIYCKPGIYFRTGVGFAVLLWRFYATYSSSCYPYLALGRTGSTQYCFFHFPRSTFIWFSFLNHAIFNTSHSPNS